MALIRSTRCRKRYGSNVLKGVTGKCRSRTRVGIGRRGRKEGKRKGSRRINAEIQHVFRIAIKAGLHV